MNTLLKDCTKGMLYAPDGRRWPVRVVEEDNEHALLYFNGYDGYGLQFGTRVDFYDDMMGIIRTNCEVRVMENTDLAESPEQFMGVCKILEVQEVVQRHLDVRTGVSIACSFSSDRRADFRGVIYNLSAGGIGLVTRCQLENGEQLGFSYAFRTINRPFTVEVLREQQETDAITKEQMDLLDEKPSEESEASDDTDLQAQENGAEDIKEKSEAAKETEGQPEDLQATGTVLQGPIHCYGCRFIAMTPGAESAVRNYVFNTIRRRSQREDREIWEKAMEKDEQKRRMRLQAAQGAYSGANTPYNPISNAAANRQEAQENGRKNEEFHMRSGIPGQDLKGPML